MLVYPLLDEVMTAVLLEEVETCVLCFHITAAQYIANRPILELCLAAELRSGVWVTHQWWKYAGINFGQEV